MGSEVTKLQAIRANNTAPESLHAFPKVVRDIFRQAAIIAAPPATGPPAAAARPVAEIPPTGQADVVDELSSGSLDKLFRAIGCHRSETGIKEDLRTALTEEVDVDSMTVKQLQEELRKWKKPTSGLKSTLQTRLREALTPTFNGVRFTRRVVAFALETMA